METSSSTSSLWLATPAATAYPPLGGPVDVDVAVIGGGIAGMTIALRLKRAGARVAVLEAARVASGVTGCTSAKVTALQSTILSTITRSHDHETAALYAKITGLDAGGGQAGCQVQRAAGRRPSRSR